jgi:nitrogen fixation-related uncharacterized protein
MFPLRAQPFRLRLAVLAVVLLWWSSLSAQFVDLDWTGERIMAESNDRHQQFPYIYEEQTMVLVDSAGHRDVRRCRRFTRYEEDGHVKFLLIFDEPDEIRGVALLAVRQPSGVTVRHVYLPAFGPHMKEPADGDLGDHFLGTDFAVEDLTPDVAENFRYVRQRDRIVEDVEYFVVDAYPSAKRSRLRTAYGLRRNIIRKDSFMIVQTDVYDSTLRFYKRITHHDLRRVDGKSWRANMIIANDSRESHHTLLKIDRRVYSRDYVPASLFEPKYLTSNAHVTNAAVGVVAPQASEAERQLIQRSNGS